MAGTWKGQVGQGIAWLLLGMTLLAAGLFAHYRPDRAIRIGVASVSQLLCEQTFIAGLDPQRVFREEVQPKRGLRVLLKRLRYRIDRPVRQVQASWAGHFASIARFEPGTGCVVHDAGHASPAAMSAAKADASQPPPISEDPQIITGSTPLQAALDQAFAEPARPPYRRVRAIVIMRSGRIVAERYAAGITPDTPLLGYSVSKSVIHALVGILVGDGVLDIERRAPVAAWRDPDDPRHAITLDQLLRMSSGLALEESDSGFDPVSRMLFLHGADMARYAEQAPLQAPPGSVFSYTSGNTLIASEILRDAVGGNAAAVRHFAQQRLFEPLGMMHATMEFDDAGTPVGSTRMLASARDWGRFGQLYLDRGYARGRRLLPADWVDQATTPTLGQDYGSGFWLNTGRTANSRWRIAHGMPADAFYASGLFGQRIVIIPSQQLVIVRFGATIDPPDFDMPGLVRLVADVIKVGKRTDHPP